MSRGNELELAVLVDYMDRTPVGQSGHAEAGEIAQRGLVIQRSGQDQVCLGKEGEPAIQPLRLRPGELDPTRPIGRRLQPGHHENCERKNQEKAEKRVGVFRAVSENESRFCQVVPGV
jgi:hypothetical protein